MDNKKKVTVKEGESLVLKSNGKEYTFDGKNLFVKEDKRKPYTATVLKSLRTESGARDWVRVMSERYDGAKIVETTALKSYRDVDGKVPEGYNYHVIMEQDVEAVKAQQAVMNTLKGLIESGYMEVTEEGPAFTDKWTDKVREFTTQALAGSLKSVSDNKIAISVNNMNETTALIVAAHGEILKAVEDAEKLANTAPATENADYGHALRPNVSISDEEVRAATQVSRSHAPAADVSDKKMEGSAVTDEMADKATHMGDHNKGDSGMNLGTSETAIKSADSDDESVLEETMSKVSEGEDLSETEEDLVDAASDKGKKDTKKSVSEQVEEEEASYEDTTFKSLSEAKAWNNPNPDRWHVVPASFDDKKKYGRNKAYIVKERDPRPVTGAYGNRV